MVSSVLAAVGVIFVWGIYSLISNLRSNILKARKTGIPYVVSRKFEKTALSVHSRDADISP